MKHWPGSDYYLPEQLHYHHHGITLVVRHLQQHWVRVGIPVPPSYPFLSPPPLDGWMACCSVFLPLTEGWLLCRLSNVPWYGWNSIYSWLLRNSQWMSWENWIFLKCFFGLYCLASCRFCCSLFSSTCAKYLFLHNFLMIPPPQVPWRMLVFDSSNDSLI